MIDGSIQNLWESRFLSKRVTYRVQTLRAHSEQKHITVPARKKYQAASNTPLANLQSHTSQRKRPNLSHLACAANAAQAD